MISDAHIEIDASAGVVWDVFVDVERWPEWTASVERIVALDGPAIEVGNRFEIKQPRMPTLVWEVTEVRPGVSWTWRQRYPVARPWPPTRSCHSGATQRVCCNASTSAARSASSSGWR